METNLSLHRLLVDFFTIDDFSSARIALKDFLSSGGDVNAVDAKGYTLLMRVARRSAFLTRMLIVNGASVNASTPKGVTALMTATVSNKKRNAELLLQAGADVNQVDESDMTALMKAAMLNRIAVARLLLKHGASTTLQSSEGATALLYARSPIMKSLLIGKDK